MTKASALDRRVKKEAQALLGQARQLLRNGSVKADAKAALQLAVDRVVERIDGGAGAVDLRLALPALDAAVDAALPQQAQQASTFEYIEPIVVAVAIALLLRTFVVEAFKIPSASMYPTLEISDHIFVNKPVYGMRMPFSGKKLFNTRSPKPGEVVVFIQPCEPKDYIKRVIATEGQTVELRCNQLYIDGKAVPRTLIPGAKCLAKAEVEDCEVYQETIGEHTFRVYQSKNGSRSFPTSSRPPSCTAPHDAANHYAGNPDSAPQAPGQIVGEFNSADRCSLQARYIVPKGHLFMMGDNRDNSTDSRVWGSAPLDNTKGKAMFIWLSFDNWSWFPWNWNVGRMGQFVH